MVLICFQGSIKPKYRAYHLRENVRHTRYTPAPLIEPNAETNPHHEHEHLEIKRFTHLQELSIDSAPLVPTFTIGDLSFADGLNH